MAPHIYNGLVGLWVIEDALSKVLPLQNHYGIDYFPLIIQDKQLNNFGQPIYKAPINGGFLGDTLFVNGAQSPFVEVLRVGYVCDYSMPQTCGGTDYN